MEEIYATLLYYFVNREQMDQYLADWLAHGEAMHKAQGENPPGIAKRMQNFRQQNERLETA